MEWARRDPKVPLHKRPFHHPDWASADHDTALDLLGTKTENARAFIEGSFSCRPMKKMHLTGYFEPEYLGSKTRTDRFQHPIYRLPPEHLRTTKRTDVGKTLAGYELAWLADPLDAFFLQVQGSGRIITKSGTVRVGYAGKNGADYVSIGKLLIERGMIEADDISMQAIRNWAALHPQDVPELLAQNPSFVFFQQVLIPDNLGPIGTAGTPLTPMASVAVDPDVIPLGTLVWMCAPGLNVLAVAQDTGSAIKGDRIDLFTGTGDDAGEIAGLLNKQVPVFVLHRDNEP